ncbi:hypothetical protein EDB83DRAFT_2326673 [Lactarius deliciosus]|nr:hypothetical protein EDB83DRAFT_2326673 [Lactarius deliciosus]
MAATSTLRHRHPIRVMTHPLHRLTSTRKKCSLCCALQVLTATAAALPHASPWPPRPPFLLCLDHRLMGIVHVGRGMSLADVGAQDSSRRHVAVPSQYGHDAARNPVATSTQRSVQVPPRQVANDDDSEATTASSKMLTTMMTTTTTERLQPQPQQCKATMSAKTAVTIAMC